MSTSAIAIAPTTKTKWIVDPAHSEIIFKVKHLMIANVKGAFRTFDIIIDGEDITGSGIHVSIDAASITTNNNDRDSHLRSADFFDVANHPVITFDSTAFDLLEDGIYLLKGVLQMRGITRDISLDVEFGGFVRDPDGDEKAIFSISGRINRKDWGLNWNAVLETGGVLVGDDIRISADIQFVKTIV